MSTPEVSGMNQVIQSWVDQDETPVLPANAMTGNDVRLSKNQKFRVEHDGFAETENDYIDAVIDDENGDKIDRSTTNYVEVGGVKTYVAPVADISPKATSGVQDARDGVPSHSDFKSMYLDNLDPVIVDLPGRSGGEAMTDENYKELSGWPQVNDEEAASSSSS